MKKLNNLSESCFLKLFQQLTVFERLLWITSVVAIVLSYALFGKGEYLNLIASLIGVTALIFVAKGYVIGQILTVVFAVFYGIISFFFQYYGEMITYLGMSAPIALLSAIQWMRHPYKDTAVVTVHRVTAKNVVWMCVWTALVTTAFYFILGAIGNANLVVSIVSVTTSFLASYLTFLRSPYYALAYAANDVVLVVLWVLASITDVTCIPIVVCFVMFLANDLYGFFNWRSMQHQQQDS